MVVLDTTEYMRNCDYFPTRLSAEQEAAFHVFTTKLNANPQNTVGLMTLSGTVKVSFVSSSGRFQAGLRETQIDRTENPTLCKAIQVAQLALRHRHSTQRQRIIAFIGSPVSDSEQDLKKLAAKLKKNGIALDLVSFGQEGENSSVLSEFVAATNSTDPSHSSHFLDAPPGVDELVDQLSRSEILGGSGAGNAFGNDDLDMDDDPELMMALRMSLEEQRAREQTSA